MITKPSLADLKEINQVAKQVHDMHVAWRPDIYVVSEAPMDIDYYRDLLQNNGIFVFKESDRIIGYITFSFFERSNAVMRYKKILHIEQIAVDEKSRNRGVGGRLICHVIDYAKSLDCTDMMLTVSKDNIKAQKFYEKLGMDVENIKLSMSLEPK